MNLEGVRQHEPTEIDDGEQEAAVVVPVVHAQGAGRPAIMFIKRADHLSDHPGQMSFPGGGREPEDTGLTATAGREADEEVGLAAEELSWVGRLDDIRTVTRYVVRPFVAEVPDRTYHPGDDEVAEVAVLPVAALTDRDNYESERREHPYYGEIRLHYFNVDGYTVWGATGRMLVQLLELATGWEMPTEVDRVVGSDADLPS